MKISLGDATLVDRKDILQRDALRKTRQIPKEEKGGLSWSKRRITKS